MKLVYDFKAKDLLINTGGVNGKLLVDNIENYLSNIKSIDELMLVLEKATGFYSFIIELNNNIIFGVDCIRSKPLFYTKTDNAFIISDDFFDISKSVEVIKAKRCEEEFLHSGYISGNKTIYNNIYQVEAGSIVIFSKETLKLELKDYFVFNHKNIFEISDEVFLEKIDEKFQKAISRAIKFADGRKIVLPLSGGYDSRLIALYLRKNGYENVLCFSYGVINNAQAKYSHKIAKILDFEWHFIEYTEELWKKNWSSRIGQDYQKLAFNGASLPHVQDWLAVKLMLEKGVIDNGCVFIPGHAGDFVAGSHMPLKFDKEIISVEGLLNYILKKNYSNKNITLSKEVLFKDLKKQLNLDNKKNITNFEYMNLYEQWIWRERQAKYITNSVRVYEQFGADWWLPFWDKEFVDLWNHADFSKRKKRHLYIKFVENNFYDFTKIRLGDAGDKASNYLKFKYFIKKVMPKFLKEYILMKKSKKINNNILMLGSISYNYKELLIDYYCYNIIGIYSYLFLNGIWGEVKEENE